MKRYGLNQIMRTKKYYKDNTTNKTILIQYDQINFRYNVILLNTKTLDNEIIGYIDYRTHYNLYKEKTLEIIHSKTAQKYRLNTYLKKYELIIE